MCLMLALSGSDRAELCELKARPASQASLSEEEGRKECWIIFRTRKQLAAVAPRSPIIKDCSSVCLCLLCYPVILYSVYQFRLLWCPLWLSSDTAFLTSMIYPCLSVLRQNLAVTQTRQELTVAGFELTAVLLPQPPQYFEYTFKTHLTQYHLLKSSLAQPGGECS